MIRKVEIKVSTSGSDAAATGTGSTPVPLGRLVAMYLDFHASAPATTDTTVKATGDPATRTLLTVTNSATDAWLFPGDQVDDETAAAVTGAYREQLIHGGTLQIELAGCNALTDALTATCYIEV